MSDGDERIVVARLTALGDAILALPALEALARARNGARITFVTGADLVPLVRELPFVHEALPWSRRRAGGGETGHALAGHLLASGPVDVYVDLQGKVRTRRLGRLLHPARRIAFKKRTTTGTLFALLGHDQPLSGRHQTRLYLDTLAPLGVDGSKGEAPPRPRLVVPADVKANAAPIVETLRPGPVVAVAPGARWQTKRWDAARFARVARHLVEQHRARLALVGGPGDAEALDIFRTAYAAPITVDTETLSLVELAAILEHADLLLAGDTGPGHLAAALGVPVVSIFGPTAPSRWAPAGASTRVVCESLPCAPCSNHGGRRCPEGHHRCLVELPIDPVIAACEALLAERLGRSPPAAASNGGAP